MELENLKNLWHKFDKTETKVPVSEIQSMLHQKSTDALYKLKNRLFWDLTIGTIGSFVFISLGWMSHDIAWQILGWFMGIIYLPWVLLGWNQYNRLRKVNFSNVNLKEQLVQMVNYWEAVLRRSLLIQRMMAPLGFLLGFRAGANWGGEQDFISLMLNKPAEPKTFLIWGIMLVILITCLIVTDYYVRWYIKSFFGSQVNRLKECLQALAEE
jgi:hypothetical protein